MTDVTVTTAPPAPNSTEARTPDGTLKDQSPNTTPTPTEPSPPEGGSFLTDPDVKPEIKPEGESKPEDAPKPEAPAGAPEKYADFKLPEGYQFDAAELTKATTLFKEMNLSQDQAQKLVDHYAENNLQAAQAPYKAWADLQKQWTTEIGNRFPGEKGSQIKGMISNVIDTVLSPSLAKNFRTALNLTGAGSNPDIVEALSIMLKPLSEGTPVRGNGPTKPSQSDPSKSDGPLSAADAIYPHLRK